MTQNNTLVAAISLAVLDADADHRSLLDSVVLAAQAIFEAAASSIFLLDTTTGELVFEAVSGQGESFLVGSRFPASQGVAGWVLETCEPVIVDDVAHDPRFARDVAESTRYVPRTLMATPVMCDEEAIGVLEVLDAAPGTRSSLVQLELLGLFGQQAAVALRIVQRSRAARALLMRGTSAPAGPAGQRAQGKPADGAELDELMAVARMLGTLEGERRQAGLQLLGSMRTLLS
jgi:GAF domain-containing protein